MLRYLRAYDDDIPAAVITGMDALDDRVDAQLKELHADIAYKPLWADSLVGLVGRLLAHDSD